MVNETITTSDQPVDKSQVGQANPLDLVNGEATKTNSTLGTDAHKGFLDNLVRSIALMLGKPDPFTGKSVSTTAKVEVPNVVQTQTKAPEFKAENQTITENVQEGGLLDKFASILDNVGGKVETLGDKALGSATNIVNQSLEKAETVGNNVVSQAKKTVEDTSNQIKDAVKLEEPKPETEVK